MGQEIYPSLPNMWEEIEEGRSTWLEEELRREVSLKHPLFGKEAWAIARREDRDDVLFWLPDLNQYAIVHLTFSCEDSTIWPRTKFFSKNELEVYCKEMAKYDEEE